MTTWFDTYQMMCLVAFIVPLSTKCLGVDREMFSPTVVSVPGAKVCLCHVKYEAEAELPKVRAYCILA